MQPGYGNTAPLQLDIDVGTANGPDGLRKIASLIEAHFNMGGTLINVNILDATKLLEAHRDPTRYPNLIVRVTGFSAYFASLSHELRQMVVDRIIKDDLAHLQSQ